MLSSSTSSSTTSKQIGRPKLNDTDIENDNTGTSSDMGNNVSDIKKYSSSDLKDKDGICIICGKELNFNENKICDDCLETMYQERIDSLNQFNFDGDANG